MANQTAQIAPPTYPSINFIPPVPILQPPPPTPKPTMTNISYPFTPIVPSNHPPQLPPQPQQPIQPIPSAEIQTIKKKQNSFDLPDNCPNSLR